MTGARIARVRWRGTWWSPSTATRVRIYARPADAVAAFDRLKREGYMVELCHAKRTPWRLTWAAAWTPGPEADKFRALAAEMGVAL